MNAFAVALLFQVAAAGAVPAVGGPADMVSLPAGTVRVNGLAATAGNRPRLFSARTSPVEIRGPIDWEVPEAGRGVADGSPWSSFRLPAGRYVLLLERGPLVPILKAEAEVTAGKETAITAREIEGRRLSVRITDTAKAPVRGRLDATGAPPFDRALVALLSRRAAPPKEDGLLGFGLVPAEEPLTLRVSAPGFRTATLKLGARFEQGRRDVVLAPNQDVEVRVAGLAGRRGEARPEVTLARCRNQKAHTNCNPGERKRRMLDEEGKARFQGVEGGFYGLEVRAANAARTHETVEVASDGDAPTLVVDLVVGEWTLRGTTRLHGGGAVIARVDAMEFVHGVGEGTAAETRSAADGTFEMKVVSRAGNKIGLGAESDDPRALTPSPNLVSLVDGNPVVEGVDLELDATGLEIAVRDARTSQPLSGCPIGITWDNAFESRTSVRNTDESGTYREYGLAEGVVRVRVQCEKHYAKDMGRVDVVRDEVKRLEILVEPARDLVVSVRDESGAPFAGASALVSGGADGRGETVASAGVTDAAGEILLKGDVSGGRTLFVVAAGRPLAMTALPAPASCDRSEDCRVDVVLRPPAAFAGLSVRNESGRPISRQFLLLSRGGVPFPNGVLTAVLTANGLAAEPAAMPLEVRVASFLPEGTYAVTTQHLAVDEATKKKVWKTVPLGGFSVPSLERVELLDRDGAAPKPPDAQAPRVAAR